ncbi:MAG TPA: hypothetical protein VHH72_10545 [Solirubrobacterales bacterium]|jgi:hypothetical protein|nr:hypothetical protein [Solirubrobacterales bacterium]
MATPEGGAPEPPEPASGNAELRTITERLDSLARELDSDPDEARAAELIREASDLATRAGREVERALQAAAETRES